MHRMWGVAGDLQRYLMLGVLIFLALAPPPFEARKSSKSKDLDVEESDDGLWLTEKVWITGNVSRHSNCVGGSATVLKIGSFNLKQFGRKKSNNDEALKIIAKIVSRYDLIALQEITDVKENSIKRLMEAIRRESPFTYQLVISARVGRTKQKEQYGLIFKPDIFQTKRHILYDDTDHDHFAREPQIAEFNLKGERIALINVHVAPKNAFSEVNSLTDVHDWVEDTWSIKNVIVLGDLNAACDYIRKKDIPNIRLLNNPTKYKWLIPNNVDTTVGNTTCAYDRIIISGPYLHHNLVQGSPRAFEFDKEFGMDQKAALVVSDHYPVEFSISIGRDGGGAHDEPCTQSSSSLLTRPSTLVKAYSITVTLIVWHIYFCT